MNELDYLLIQLEALPKHTVITSNMLISMIQFAQLEVMTELQAQNEREAELRNNIGSDLH